MGDFWNWFQGQPNPNEPAGLAVPPASGRELLFRALGGIVPPPGQMRVPKGPGGMVLGGLARFGSGLAGASAEEMARMRNDPLARQFLLGQRGLEQASGVMMPGVPGQSLPVEGPMPESGPFYPQIEGVVGQRPVVEIPGTPPKPPGSLPEFLQYATPTQRAGFQMARMAGIPEAAFYRDALREAQTRRAELEAGPLGQAQLDASIAQRENLIAQTKEAQRKTQAEIEQDKRDEEFNKAYNQAAAIKKAPLNPSELASIAAATGASKKATESLLSFMTLGQQMDYHNGHLDYLRDSLKQGQVRFDANLAHGDIDSARQIVNSELQRLETFKKEKQGALSAIQKSIDGNIKALAEFTTRTNPQMKEIIEAELRQDRLSAEALAAMIRSVEPDLQDARSRMKKLFEQTKAGKNVLKEQPTPTFVPAPPGFVPGRGVFRPGASPVEIKRSLLEDFGIR